MGLIGLIGPMGLIGLIGPIGLSAQRALMGLALIGLALTGCSPESEDLSQQQEHALLMEAALLAPDYEDLEENDGDQVTRSWEPPTTPIRYYLYDALYEGLYANYDRVDLDNRTIGVFLTHTTGEGDPTTDPNPLKCRLKYVAAKDEEPSKWKLMLPTGVLEESVARGNYYIYGFIPNDAARGAELTGNPTYDEGAVLTIQGLQTVMADACVIIGAKEGPDADHDNGLKAGDFKAKLETGSTTVGGKIVYDPNYLFFLFDHLCSALSINMNVSREYNNLRTIKVKKLAMQIADDMGMMKARMNVKVTLKANTTGSNPIQSVEYSSTGGVEDDSYGIVFNSNDGLELSTEESKFLCHFIPIGAKTIYLISTYDVYDRKGNLVRQNSTATNKLDISKVFASETETKRGRRYTIKLTIKPTYLYVMSEPDLDNPTIEEEEEE